MTIRSRMIVLPLVTRLRLNTNGNAFGAGTTLFYEVDVPDFTDLLPIAEGLTLVSLTENPTLKPFAVGAVMAAAGPKRHTAYNVLANFLLESRLVIGVGNGAGSVLNESAQLSATLLVKTLGM